MIQRIVLAAGLLAAFSVVNSNEAQAIDPLGRTHRWNQAYAQQQPWHGSYNQIQYGRPLALVVPPTAHMRQTYSWGVGQNLTHPIYHQYQHNTSSPGAYGARFRGTPAWPSHTDQFGAYYVRGPW